MSKILLHEPNKESLAGLTLFIAMSILFLINVLFIVPTVREIIATPPASTTTGTINTTIVNEALQIIKNSTNN
jgi:hypothetical protein